MKLDKNAFFLVIDYGMLVCLIVAGFAFPVWGGGPFVGAFFYAVLRHVFAVITGDFIHNRPIYRLWDMVFIGSLAVAGFTFPEWSGGPFVGAFAGIVLRFLLEGIMRAHGWE